MLSDLVHVADRGLVRLRTGLGEIIAGRSFGEEKSVVEVKGWVKLMMRERGKIVPGSHREGHNVWTNTGREYLTLLMQKSYGVGTNRNDRMNYIGVGKGMQLEDPGVIALADPLAYLSGVFLAQMDQVTFPLTPLRTTARYHRIFSDSEIPPAGSGDTVYISELGLFTDGSPSSNYDPGTRDTGFTVAADQPPMAYKAIEPVGKTANLELEVFWEIRL
jgi:hypothetical protein